MRFDTQPDDTSLSIAEAYAEAELLGYSQHAAEDAICEYLTELRTTARQLRWLNSQLGQFGLVAIAAPVRRVFH